MAQLIHNLLISVSDLSTVHWIIIALLVILGFNCVYGKTIKPLLRKIGIHSQYIIPFSDSIWQFCFLLVCIPMIFVSLEENIYNSWTSILDEGLTKCKSHDAKIEGSKTIFIMVIAFTLNDIFNTWIARGFKNIDFYKKQVFFAIMILAYYMRCPSFGITLFVVSNVPVLCELASKLCFFLEIYTKNSYLRILSGGIYAIAILFWLYTYLYVYPIFLTHNKSVNSAMMKAELNMLIVLDFFMWVDLVVSVIISMFTRMIISYVMSSKNRPRILAYYLFGCDPWIAWLNRLGSSYVPGDDQLLITPAQRQLLRLRATIYCRNSIMRKVRRIRANREQEHST